MVKSFHFYITSMSTPPSPYLFLHRDFTSESTFKGQCAFRPLGFRNRSHLTGIFITMAICPFLLIYSHLHGPPRGNALGALSPFKEQGRPLWPVLVLWMESYLLASYLCRWRMLTGNVYYDGSVTSPGFSCWKVIVGRFRHGLVLYFLLTSFMLLRKSACNICIAHISRYAVGMRNSSNFIDETSCVVEIYPILLMTYTH